MKELFDSAGFGPADILLPQGCDMTKWSVVACDQYTFQPDYWEKVEQTVGSAPSALRLMLPEVYLGRPDTDARIALVNGAMRDYLARGLFRSLNDSFVYVERTLQNGKIRKGLIGAVDLEKYDYRLGSGSLIRATEGTVLERIPPRMKVREHAPLEMPHVMLLIDDEKGTVVERAGARRADFEKLYDFDLMQGGGHIAGYRVSGNAGNAGNVITDIARALSRLADPAVFSEKYGVRGCPTMAVAVGDGNHSLATAKACYERLKAEKGARAALKARYALAELVNLHDDALEFEPIHRVVFGVEPEKLIGALRSSGVFCDRGPGRAVRYAGTSVSGATASGVLYHTGECLAVGVLQNFLDGYLKENGGSVDYIHGEDVAASLARKPGTVCFLLPAMEKSELFPAVIAGGALPRKTFSMGEAHDKRFYLECREIG